MCYFITVALDQKHETALKQKLRGSFTLTRSENSSITDHLESDDVSFLITDGTCACDIFAKPQSIVYDEEKLRQKYSKPKYKKLGWTEAEIERAVAAKLAQPAKDFSGLRADLRWSLCDLVSVAKRAVVIVHFYSGDVETEEVAITERKIVSCRDLRDKDESVEEDMLVEIIL